MKIRYKIVIPFTLLFVIATFITALVTLSLMGRNLNARVESRLSEASRMISRVEFALNPSILANLKVVSGADVVTYRKDGTVLATTLDQQTQAEFLRLVQSENLAQIPSGPDTAAMTRDVQLKGVPYKIAYRALDSTPDAVVALITRTSDISDTQDEIAHSVFLIALVIVAAMSVVAYFIARSVTSPVLELVEFTKKVAAGDLTQKARVHSAGEIGLLAEAFNEMMDQLHRSEEKLLQSEKLAVAGLMAARVAHDIRNPLSAIKMQAQLLLIRPKGEAELREVLEAVLRHIDRVEWVVQGILDTATPQNLHREMERVDIVLDEVLRLTEAQLKHRKNEVRREYEAPEPYLMLDRKRFQLALMNLITNAAEAMPNGGVLGVSIHTEQAGAEIVIGVSDDGVGIDPSIRGRLFDPFVTTKREGIGLGLLSTKNVIERHGGKVQLLPKNGSGTHAIIRMAASAGQPASGTSTPKAITEVESTDG